MHETQEEADVGVVGGKHNVPVRLQKAQDAKQAQAFGQGLLGLGEAVKDDLVQTAVQAADDRVPLGRGILDDLRGKNMTHTHTHTSEHLATSDMDPGYHGTMQFRKWQDMKFK